MRRIVLFLIVLSLSSAAHGWEASKVDQKPVFSRDGRFLVFERGYCDSHGVVVWDLRTSESTPVVGRLTQVSRKGRSSFAATGWDFVTLISENGEVGPTVWNKGAGLPCISMLEEDIGNPQWRQGRLRFQTRDMAFDYILTWSFNPNNGKASLISNVRSDSNRTLVNSYTLTMAARLSRLHGGIAPAISPDSQTLALAAIGPGDDMTAWEKLGEYSEWQNIYLLNRDGSSLRRLTSGGGTHPVWHPNGKGLAYIMPKGDLAWINRDGSGFTRLVKGIKVSKGLIWDPDGRSFRVLQQTHNGIAWYRIVPPSNTLRVIGKPRAVPPDTQAFLSPSGKKMVWSDSGYATTSLTLVSGTKKTVFKIPNGHTGNWHPSAGWSADESKVAIAAVGSINVIDVTSGKIRQLTGRLY
jgi:Tol biopolymer transport system component